MNNIWTTNCKVCDAFSRMQKLSAETGKEYYIAAPTTTPSCTVSELMSLGLVGIYVKPLPEIPAIPELIYKRVVITTPIGTKQYFEVSDISTYPDGTVSFIHNGDSYIVMDGKIIFKERDANRDDMVSAVFKKFDAIRDICILSGNSREKGIEAILKICDYRVE